jgi:predicted aconitase
MKLTIEEQHMLYGVHGRATQKAMEILVALGTIYGAERMVPVTSVQIAGVSYDNLGEAGLHWLSEMADGGGKTRVLTTLNPAGMDIENWPALGISEDFARQQLRVIDAFARMNVVTTCSCTPYLIGNSPHFGQHIAWSESSAVCYANSIIGARSNREGGPSALAAALTGVTPEYGMHLTENRCPDLTIHVEATLPGNNDFGSKRNPSPTSPALNKPASRISNRSARVWQPTAARRCSTCAASPRKPIGSLRPLNGS